MDCCSYPRPSLPDLILSWEYGRSVAIHIAVIYADATPGIQIRDNLHAIRVFKGSQLWMELLCLL